MVATFTGRLTLAVLLAAGLQAQSGEPEVPDQFIPIPESAQLSPSQVKQAYIRYNALAKKLNWWKLGLDPAALTHPLREAAEFVRGGAAAFEAKLEGASQALETAREAADFLIWAQQQAGTGVYPFPAYRGESNAKAMQAAQGYLKRAEQRGLFEKVVRNGWLIDDTGDGGLQFDNGEAGVAMLRLYGATKERKYLESALKSAGWAAARPIVRNWNYNSFSVYLLAAAFNETGEARYLEAAKQKALTGVIPGQLTAGPHAGRWADPHNARPTYHYIMMRALAELYGAMPADDSDRPRIRRALQLGLLARNADFVERGAPCKDSALDALLVVERVFAADPKFLRETRSDVALERLKKLLAAEYLSGKLPTAPGPWGTLLHDSR